MRTIIIFAALSLFLLQTPCVQASDSVQVKHFKTLFADNASIPFHYPEGIACNAGSFVLADTGNARLVRFAVQGQSFTADAVFPLPQAPSPIVVQMNSKGDIYVLDGKERRIFKLSRSGEPMGFLKPLNVPPPEKIVPRSFRIDDADNIYLLDIFSQRVLVLDGEGHYVRHISFPEKYGFFSDLAVTRQGIVYLLDSVDAVVLKAAPDAKGFDPLTGTMKDLMNFPNSIAVDNGGILYLADQNGGGMALVGRDGSFLGRKLGMGWEDGQLNYPAKICINEQDTLFIADRNNNRLQLFDILKKQE